MAKPKRVPLNRLVLPATFALVKTLAEQLECSEGDVLDKAVTALSVAESFGPQHLRVDHNNTEGILHGRKAGPDPQLSGLTPGGSCRKSGVRPFTGAIPKPKDRK